MGEKSINKITKVSAVILTWNRKDDLVETLSILEKDPYPDLEIIVVDNNSSDDTKETVSKLFPDVSYIMLKANLGITGYNAGFKAASGEAIVTLDSDSYPHKDAIARMVAMFNKNPDAGIIAFDVHTPTPKSIKNIPEDVEPQEVYGYHGAGAGIRKEVFQKAGYWHDPFFLYMNEMDHAMRVINAGYKILHSPSVRAFHKSSAVSRPSRNGAYFYLRNSFWLVWRNFPLAPMLWATLQLLHLSVRESILQKTDVYLEAAKDAFLNIFQVFRTRNPIKSSMFKKFRIPLNLVFSRWE